MPEPVAPPTHGLLCVWPITTATYDRDHLIEKGAWHLALEDVRPVWREIEARGLQAVPWTLPDDVEAAVRAYLDGVKVSG